jgi:hypothetical protein
METVTHSDQPGAETAGAFDGDFDRLVTGEMTECVIRVENDGCAFVRHDFASLFQRHGPFPDPIEIHLHQHDAVRGLPFEVGIHQSPGNGSCRHVGDAGRNEEPRHQRAQLLGCDGNGAAHIRPCRSRAAA